MGEALVRKQTNTGRKSVRSFRQDVSSFVFSPYSLRAHEAPHASPSAPAVGHPSGPSSVVSKGKTTALCTFVCTLHSQVVSLVCTLPLASAEENKFMLSWAEEMYSTYLVP